MTKYLDRFSTSYIKYTMEHPDYHWEVFHLVLYEERWSWVHMSEDYDVESSSDTVPGGFDTAEEAARHCIEANKLWLGGRPSEAIRLPE